MNKENSVWIIDDDESIRWVLEKSLSEEGFEVSSFESADQALKKIKLDPPQVILSDIRMTGTTGIELLDEVNKSKINIPIIIMTAHSDLKSAVESYEHGAWEYLPKPFDIKEVIKIVGRAIKGNEKKTKIDEADTKVEIIGEAAAMQEVYRAIGKLSNSNSTVLLVGESGTGKELVAKAIYQHSLRRNNPFIALNMADIPKDLLEAELFGHERGAFTGAEEKRIGRFEQANEGTLFLDEIGDMPLETQTRLLRVLANGEFYRVGGREPVKVNVRIIAATHQNLENNVKKRTFREDLFHRLNVIKLILPKLNERKEDISVLAKHFLKISSKEIGEFESKYLSKEVEEYFLHLPWPGNVRQLENVCKWLTVMSPSQEIRIEDLPKELLTESSNTQKNNWSETLRKWVEDSLLKGETNILEMALPEFEKTLIEEALKKTKGKKKEAAKLLGWGRNTLTRKIKETGIK